MIEEDRLAMLRREIVSERMQRAEKNRASGREEHALTRIHLDRWRKNVRRRYLEAWREDTAHKLGRPRETVRLLSIAKTYALQNAQIETYYLQATGRILGFTCEWPSEQRGEIERLLDKLGKRLPDSPIYILRGVASFWMRAWENEPGEEDVWGNGSSYFGAIKATSTEVLANAAAWIGERDFVSTFISAIDAHDTIEVSVGHARGLSRDLSYDGLAYGLDLYGPQWGGLLADEQSDWNYAEELEHDIARRAQRDVQRS